MTGIDDVARDVGLSTATVSRALRDLPGVSHETRARVVEAASRLGYVASPAASSLAGGKTRTVAIVAPYATRWYFATVIEGAESVLRESSYDVLLYSLGGDREARRRVLGSHLLSKRVDGVIIVGIEPTPEEREWLDQHAPPLALVGVTKPGSPSVRIDDWAAAHLGMRHLLELGHRRIGYVGGSDNEPLDFTTPQARLTGYRDALTEAGIDLRPDYETYGHFTIEGGLAAGHALLTLPDRPTAVMCASDEMALGVLSAARDLGLEVPSDVSVVGIDDHVLAAYVGLTTVRQPVTAQGQLAASALLELITQRRTADGPATGQDVVLPAELVLRSSTGPLGAAQPAAGSRRAR